MMWWCDGDGDDDDDDDDDDHDDRKCGATSGLEGTIETYWTMVIFQKKICQLGLWNSQYMEKFKHVPDHRSQMVIFHPSQHPLHRLRGRVRPLQRSTGRVQGGRAPARRHGRSRSGRGRNGRNAAVLEALAKQVLLAGPGRLLVDVGWCWFIIRRIL